MFESGYAEGGPGKTQIWIKDTKVSTFNLLLDFMSTGRLAAGSIPEIIYADALQAKEHGGSSLGCAPI